LIPAGGPRTTHGHIGSEGISFNDHLKFRPEELQTGNAEETESDDEAPMCEGVDPLFRKPTAHEPHPEGQSYSRDIEM
jgi:hypothetical protein